MKLPIAIVEEDDIVEEDEASGEDWLIAGSHDENDLARP
ncbi:hypothetical protein TIFTF001_025411 [Ficus carica]|uniref:Uncharacterized protein n=1 Tax=Ficus carica TaxID=3494 RepID=A0AA88B1D7_FICCA|nr:hypothetical protein TIFTF001_025411 [Ficus carica]